MRRATPLKIHLYNLLVICCFAQYKTVEKDSHKLCNAPFSELNPDLSFACRRVHEGFNIQFEQIMNKLKNIRNTQPPPPPPPPPSPSPPPSPPPPPALRDCSDLACGSGSGVYRLNWSHGKQILAFCDMTYNGGGWTVIQRRADIRPQINFFRGWADYKQGFGNLTGEFWWGLERLHVITTQLFRKYRLRIDLEDFEGHWRSAEYDEFTISPEADGYRLRVAKFSGSGELGFHDCMTYHNGAKFSTFDKEQVGPNAKDQCTTKYKSGWWYKNCYWSNLNGEYLAGKRKSRAGINWNYWGGHNYSLKTVEMKIREIR